MSYVRGYVKTESGTLEIVDLDNYQGDIYHGVCGELKATGKTFGLTGWPDQKVEVYEDDWGNEFMVASNDSR